MMNQLVGNHHHQTDSNKRLIREMVELQGRYIHSVQDSLGAYDDLHDAGQLRQRDSFYKWLLSLLQPEPGQTLLDISCGQGLFVHFAAQAGLQATGIDLSPHAVATTAQITPAVDAAVADAEALPYADDSFDYVTNIGSLEHYFHPYRATQEMARILRADGLALVLTPNTFGLLGNIIYVWRHGDVFDDGQPLQRYGTNGQWQRLLESNGLRVARVLKYERALPRTWDDLLWYVLRPHKLVRALLTPIIPVNLSSFLVYLCTKTN